MERSSSQAILIFVTLLLAAAALVPAQAQDNTCTVSIRMFNDNRYVYDTDEECPVSIHSVPFGNWGVSSNVGHKENKNQFQGWYPSCFVGDSHVEWNSCSVGYVKPDLDCRRLNFPAKSGSYPFPANGYPFSDVYSHNDCATGSVPCTCVDQFSPCGPNDYGGTSYRVSVSAPYDSDCDGFVDAGGCSDLNGGTITVSNNFMTVYELDDWNTDDLIQTLYYPNVSVTLQCDVYRCWAIGDSNQDGNLDDLWNRQSPAWVWPTRYYDDWNQQRKRIDATIRIGRVTSSYSGADQACNEVCMYPFTCLPRFPGICPEGMICDPVS